MVRRRFMRKMCLDWAVGWGSSGPHVNWISFFRMADVFSFMWGWHISLRVTFELRDELSRFQHSYTLFMYSLGLGTLLGRLYYKALFRNDLTLNILFFFFLHLWRSIQLVVGECIVLSYLYRVIVFTMCFNYVLINECIPFVKPT